MRLPPTMLLMLSLLPATAGAVTIGPQTPSANSPYPHSSGNVLCSEYSKRRRDPVDSLVMMQWAIGYLDARAERDQVAQQRPAFGTEPEVLELFDRECAENPGEVLRDVAAMAYEVLRVRRSQGSEESP